MPRSRSRPGTLWDFNKGKTTTVGKRNITTTQTMNTIETTPNQLLDMEHHTWAWLKREIKSLGYDMAVRHDGSILMDIPRCDHYGHILKKIAYTYRVTRVVA